MWVVRVRGQSSTAQCELRRRCPQTLRHTNINGPVRTYHNSRISYFAKDKEQGDHDVSTSGGGLAIAEASGNAVEDVSPEKVWKSQQWQVVQKSNAPLAAWIRQDQFAAERERLTTIMNRVRERFPEQAATADKYISSLSPGFITAEMLKEYPEFNSKSLTNLEVFDFLMTFVDEKDRDPNFEHVRAFLKSEEDSSKDLAQRKRDLDAEEAQLLGKHFPDRYQTFERDPNLAKRDTIPLDDPRIYDEHASVAELLSKIERPHDPNRISRPMEKSEFFEGINPDDKETMSMRERQWRKYQEMVHLRASADKMGEKTVDEEPVVDAALGFRLAFRPTALGKYIKFSQKEQKKYIPEGWCGKFEYREFATTHETSLMMREPTLALIQKIKEAEAVAFSLRKAPGPSLLYGRPGVGKSASLQLAVYWARKSGWLVVNIKNATKWVHAGGILQKSRIFPDCWDQPHLGVKFLEHMLDAHSDKLKQIPLRTVFTLGKFDGKTLFDLVEYGAALHEYSCDAIVFFKRELERVIEFPVLIAIDDYNSLYNYNQRFREPETKRYLPRKLRNENLTLARIFLDSHLDPKLVNGTMIGAVSREPSYRHFDPEVHKTSDWVEVLPFSSKETDLVFNHYERTKYVLAETGGGTREVIRQLTSGQGHEIWKWCKSL